MRLPVCALAIRHDGAKVADSRTAEFLGIGVQNLNPAARSWQAEPKVVMRLSGKIHDHGNWVAALIEAQVAEGVCVRVASVNPLEAGVVVIQLPEGGVFKVEPIHAGDEPLKGAVARLFDDPPI